MASVTREAVEGLAAGGDNELARQFVTALDDLRKRLAASDDPALRQSLRSLVAQLGDDLRMLRESRTGRTPSPPPAEGRPFQSRPDAPSEVVARQLATLAEGTRMLIEESKPQGSALIPGGELGELTQTQQLAAMVLRARAAREP